MVRELIGVQYLRLRLFACSGGIDREIGWAHASELPDPSEWLEPGSLVMTTGLGLPEEPGTQAAYVERLTRADLGGLLGDSGRGGLVTSIRLSHVPLSAGLGSKYLETRKDFAFDELLQVGDYLDRQVAPTNKQS